MYFLLLFYFRIESEDDDNDPQTNDEIAVHFYVTLTKEFISLVKNNYLAVILGCEGWNPKMRHVLTIIRYCL